MEERSAITEREPARGPPWVREQRILLATKHEGGETVCVINPLCSDDGPVGDLQAIQGCIIRQSQLGSQFGRDLVRRGSCSGWRGYDVQRLKR